MKKNKILIGVISIMFAGIITLGIIECNNSNTKDNDKLFIGNGKFCQAKRLNGLGAIYDDDYIFFDCENQIYESYNYCNYSAPRLGYINFWSKQRKYNFCFIIALLRKVDNFSM